MSAVFSCYYPNMNKKLIAAGFVCAGLLLAVVELFLLNSGFVLSQVWNSHVNRVQEFPNFCQIRDTVGNCLDFRWHTFFTWLGLLGIPFSVLTIFFVLLYKQKKSVNALCLVLGFSIPMLMFHLGLVHIPNTGELWWFLEIANIFGAISSAALIAIGFLVAGMFNLHVRFREKKLLLKK